MLNVDTALSQMLGRLSPIGTEVIPTTEALGRVTRTKIRANLSQPPFHASAMDGYAVRHEDIQNLPATLTVIDEIPAGVIPTKSITTGQAMRIFTGAPLPDGADTVIMQESTTSTGQHVTIHKGADLGCNIRRCGNDFAKNEMLIADGHYLQPRNLGLITAANVPHVTVTRKPRVALLATGDELVPLGQPAGPGQIVSSNTILLTALLNAQGADVIDLGIAPDDEDGLRIMSRDVRDVDLFVTIGGASVGDHDLVQKVLKGEGLDVDFWRIAMKPGKPLIFGHFRDIPMLGLPGNPASAFVCALIFLLPALFKIQGRMDTSLPIHYYPLAHDLPENGPRQDYKRGQLHPSVDGHAVVHTAAQQDSAKLSVVSAADCLVIRPPHAPAVVAGTMVPVIPFDDLI
ncbi:MAG: molybdopterin molybdenumtransferase MoeA [Kordiimonas sp.]|nr:molybdopterin molybdenumtransferase MoeA [Kordiimonas sp.]